MANPLYVVNPNNDWARTSSFSGSSEEEGYEAANAGTDDLSAPWLASSGTATLTVTFGATRSVNYVAIHNTNADEGKTITLGGGISGVTTLTGAQYDSGYPKDLVAVLDTPENLTGMTFSISGNSNNWSIGRVSIGSASAIGRSFHVGAYVPAPRRMQFTDENEFGHDIRYDLGVEQWQVSGDMRLKHDTDLQTLDAIWSASRGGYYPVSVRFDSRYPPMFCRFPQVLPRDYYAPILARVSLTLREVSKGLEVVTP